MSSLNCNRHNFNENDIVENQFREKLLNWYSKNKRTLPWRQIAISEKDANKRGYAIWVSEIMLQQTQVTTVIDYYNKWMSKWPNTGALASASLDEVNKIWSGLGYYSRAKRLWEGAKKVQEQLKGQMPTTSDELEKNLPGVGRYTASAIGSIAFQNRVGVVDGNVIRVLSRLKCIGADSTSKPVMNIMWENANTISNHKDSGDLNQSLMELGALICTPKNPSCSNCPLSDQCMAFKEFQSIKDKNKAKLMKKKNSELKDIEDLVECNLCLKPGDYIEENGVMNYPRKGQKTLVKSKKDIVFLIGTNNDKNIEYLMFQRASTGLLANLLEFPTFPFESDKENDVGCKKDLLEILKNQINAEVLSNSLESCGQVVHKFSHIHQTYVIWEARIDVSCINEIQLPCGQFHQKLEWLKAEDLSNSAISTAMKKVFNARLRCHKDTTATTIGNKRKRKNSDEINRSKQKKITNFFISK